MVYKIQKEGYPPPRQFVSAETFDLAVRQWLINNFRDGYQAIPATYGNVVVESIPSACSDEEITAESETYRYTLITLPSEL